MTIHMPSDPHETDTLPPAPRDEMSLEQREVAGLSQGQIVRRRFFRHKGAMISLITLVFILVLSVSSIGWGPIPGWWKYDYSDIVAPPGGSGATFSFLWIGGSFFHWGDFPFGAPSVGYDNFAQVMRGIQQTLVIVLIMGILSTVIGVVSGALAGYYRGWIDSAIMRFTDLMITLPILLVTAVLGFVLGAHGVIPLALALGFLSWQAMTRLVRAEFLTLREREFVDAARVAGASDRRIIFKHILPNTVGVIAVQATLTISGGILAEAALGFLGFGIQPPDVSLGSLISQYQGAMLTGEPYLFLWPSVFIILIVLALNFVGDGLRDAFDPRQKRIPKAKDLRSSREQSRVSDLRAEGSADIGEY
jgi:ABC-type dipeptide/oligopeptide/nickel transport system permease subunit